MVLCDIVSVPWLFKITSKAAGQSHGWTLLNYNKARTYTLGFIAVVMTVFFLFSIDLWIISQQSSYFIYLMYTFWSCDVKQISQCFHCASYSFFLMKHTLRRETVLWNCIWNTMFQLIRGLVLNQSGRSPKVVAFFLLQTLVAIWYDYFNCMIQSKRSHILVPNLVEFMVAK